MTSIPARWDRASALAVAADGRRVPEIAQLGPGLPDLAAAFTFARDAELRFGSLRMRLEERVIVAGGEALRVYEVLLRHPGRARVTVLRPDQGTTTNHATWLSDGATVRAYQAGHRLATNRPPRPRVRGLDDPDLPGTSRTYTPLTPLPANGMPDTFVHPGGYLQNVLATGACSVQGAVDVAGRAAILVRSDHPRSTEMAGDRPDHRLEVAIDRETGLLSLLVESFGVVVACRVEATELAPDAPIPDSAFTIAVPSDADTIF